MKKPLSWGGFWALLSVLVISPIVQPPQRDLSSIVDTAVARMDSLQYILRQASTPEIGRRKEGRRVLQRRGYANVLLDVVMQDQLSALISFAKVRVQIEYSLPHNTLYLIAPVPKFGIPGIPIPEDWSWPEDPWKRN